MVENPVKISIITAVYNGSLTVGDAISSVVKQSFLNVELVVIDGGSSDGTLHVLHCYEKDISVLISESDHGIYDALNKGIKNASGDVVGFLHADDVLDNSDVLAKIAVAFQDPLVDAVYGDLVYVRHDDITQVVRYWKAGPYHATSLMRGWMPPHPTFYVRKSVYDRLGGFDTRYRIAADYDTVLRFFSAGKIHAVYIPEVLVRMRVGGVSNRSLSTIIRKSFEDLDILKRNKVGGIVSLINKNVSKLSQFWLR
jgi:glycosyltransferase involved in cell wall biosynthesis